jgi:hypothetical protein
MNRICPLENWDRGLRHGCLFLFNLCLCCSVCRYRSDGWMDGWMDGRTDGVHCSHVHVHSGYMKW